MIRTVLAPAQVDDYAEELKQAGVEKMLEQVTDASVNYPDYYLSKFHVRAPCVPSNSESFTLNEYWMYLCAHGLRFHLQNLVLDT